MTRRRIATFWVLEDTSSYNSRGTVHGVDDHGDKSIEVRLYKVQNGAVSLVGKSAYVLGTARNRAASKANRALDLLRSARPRRNSVVLASHRVAPRKVLVDGLRELGVHYVIEVDRHDLHLAPTGQPGRPREFQTVLEHASWQDAGITAPESSAVLRFARLGRLNCGDLEDQTTVALSTGGIDTFDRGLLLAITSLPSNLRVAQAAELVGWIRWIRTVTRRAARDGGVPIDAPLGSAQSNQSLAHGVVSGPLRSNLKIARKLDEAEASLHGVESIDPGVYRGVLAPGRQHRNVVELFAGAGGMGLGFLLANAANARYRILFSGEVNPTYARTLAHNHAHLRNTKLVSEDQTPAEVSAVDLRVKSVLERAADIARQNGGVDLLIGGPPCQGFSNANRNSWSSDNPNNKLVDTFLDYVLALTPRVLLMENVQGILWTPRRAEGETAELSVAQHVADRLERAGYNIYPKLLDAAWYGVPQHRNRFFLLGIHRDLGYAKDAFGSWGPFPRPTHGPMADHPFVTVQDALADLPPVGNGEKNEELPYTAQAGSPANGFLRVVRRGAPDDVLWDHVTSRHAPYVIERYRRVPPGGNWADIAEMMTNYADVERTHSNIYRRLEWRSPAITIGHYRKAMLIHPSQHRGLSLREAARLQSFPDWFRFAGSPESVQGGLTHKQQQLANAVCPLVSKAFADLFLSL